MNENHMSNGLIHERTEAKHGKKCEAKHESKNETKTQIIHHDMSF
jgi:hypothetical protein